LGRHGRPDYPQLGREGDAMNAVLEAAREYARRGWRVVPIPAGIKKPVIDGWPDLILTADDLPRYFGADQNLGIRLGAASLALVDIDLDCPAALELASLFLPDTKAKFGRKSKPLSHWLYTAPGATKEAFADPLSGEMLLELRADGRQGNAHQTLFPPSIADGERREWHGVVIAPRAIEAMPLRRAAAWLAIGCLVMRHLSETAARNPSHDMPRLLWEADHTLGRRAYRWLGLPNPDMPRARPKSRRQFTDGEIDLAEIVAAIPNNNESWDDWVAVGLGIFAAASGAGEGAIVFDDWSSKSSKYDPYTTVEKWREFHRYPPARTGIGKLIKMAAAAGWRSRKERA
jgi:Bifunctional DNA primase/polymerase, N-terminal/Primase C terminal 2 (PriCT-2)